MEKTVEYIMNKLEEYAAVVSTSGNEGEFLERIEMDFIPAECQSMRNVKTYGRPYYNFLVNESPEQNYFFTVHTDRICNYVSNKPMLNVISYENGIISGQLDNIISIAILHYLHSRGYKLNILFTTEEEELKSYLQIMEIVKLYGLNPISVDVDPVDDDEFYNTDTITLREHEGITSFHTATVKMLQNLANWAGVTYENKYGFTHDEVLQLIQKTKGGYSGAHIGLPVTNFHSNNENIRISSITNTVKLLESFAECANVLSDRKPNHRV